MMTDLRQVRDALNGRALSVCQHLLPGGRQHGGEYECGDINGGEGRSLKVRLQGDKAGVWADFAAGTSGDLLSLWAATRGLRLGDAIREACAWMGQEFRFHNQGQAKQWKRPEPTGDELSTVGQCGQYLRRDRGLSADVLAIYRVKANDRAEIIFPYWRDGQLIQQKFLSLHRDEHGKKIIRVEAGCEPGLFGWQAIAPDAREVTICEGEIDAMSLTQMGWPALSVPFGGGTGAKQDWIEHEWDRLLQFETIYLCMDSDPEGEAAAKAISSRLGEHRCRVVRLGYKDANDCLIAGGDPEEAFALAQTFDPAELKNAALYADRLVQLFAGDGDDHEGYPLPWAKLHGLVRIRPGEVSIWSGINGHGKSLMLGQVVMHGAKVGGQRVCIASLEMRPDYTLRRLTRQATGLRNPSEAFIRETARWMGEWLWIFDLVGTAKIPRLLEVFTYAYRRYGVTTFVLDSLSKCGIAEDDYIGQKALVERLCDFANEFGVHVHLVSHTRKLQDENKAPGKMDVKGTGAITDMAFNTFGVWRNKPKEEQAAGGPPDDTKPDAILTCDKQRNGEWEGRARLWFDRESFQYLEQPGEPLRRYATYSEASQ